MINAIYCGRQRKFTRILQKGFDVNFRDEEGMTLLMLVILAEKGSYQMVEKLVEHDADINAREPRQNWTALHFAARDGLADVVRLLLENDAEVDPRDSFGNTPLWRAIMSPKRSNDVIQLLLSHGADINKVNNYKVSPLGLAETIADTSLIKILKGTSD
jgi:ankyrin repeat protein